MSIFSFLVIKQAKYHYSNNPSRDQGVLARKVGSPGDIRLEPRVRDSPILAFRGRSYEFSKEKLTVFRGPKIMGLGKMVTSALNIWSFLVSPGIPRPQFLGSFRTTPKVHERPQKCNFWSGQKGQHVTFSSMPLFFGFLQYLVSTFHDIAHENSWFMTRKNGFGS